MTDGSDRMSPDPGLGERLREFDAPSDADKQLIDRMFDKVKGQCAESDRTLAGFLRSRSTLVRRAIARGTIPPAVPLRPECTSPIAPVPRSASHTGPQSAT